MVCDILLCTMIFFRCSFFLLFFYFQNPYYMHVFLRHGKNFSVLKALAVITYMRMFLRHGNLFQKLRTRQHNFKLIYENSYIPEALLFMLTHFSAIKFILKS